LSEQAFLDGWRGEDTSALLSLRPRYSAESLVAAFELALEAQSLTRRLNSVERQVLAVAALERELAAGGFGDFFTNASRIHAGVVVEALFALGCEQSARLTRGALGVLRVEPPDPAALANCMDQATPGLLTLLERSDERYVQAAEPVAERLLDWIEGHQAKIHLGTRASPDVVSRPSDRA
jgi:hypothetical protein